MSNGEYSLNRPTRVVNILCRTGSDGLRNDLIVLTQYFTSRNYAVRHVDVEFDNTDPDNQFQKFFDIKPPPPAELSISVENFFPEMLNSARNYIIPNLEYTHGAGWDEYSYFDAVLARTRTTAEKAAAHGVRAHFIGFTSPAPAPHISTNNRQRSGYLHIAGKSKFKGTSRLIAEWERHPQWPNLCVVSTRPYISDAQNVEIISKRLTDVELSHRVASAKAQIIPSEVEGWGHVLCQALVAGTLLITTDADPMNYIAGPAGITLNSTAGEGRQLTVLHKFESESLAAAIEESEKLSNTTFKARQDANLAHFVYLREQFYSRMDSLFT